MKKTLIVLALLASFQVADAQTNVNSAAKAVESALAASQNEKKATKVATWLTLASKYMDAYAAPAGSGWAGATSQELALVMKNARPVSEETVVVNGKEMTKTSYANADYYFADGRLTVIDVTKPIFENALELALAAYVKAAEVDTKGSKTADIIKGIQTVSDKYNEEAFYAYTLGDMAKASEKFEACAKAAATAPLSKEDGEAIYNAGFTASNAGNYERAKAMYEKCIAMNYSGEDGDVYAKLADAYDKLGDKEGAKNILEQGFTAYPSSQGILIGLINYYVSTNSDTDRLFTLIDNAKKNEPNNASLYYVEGNVYKELGDVEKAVAAYEKCAEINPEYEFGFIGAGILYYNQAVEIQEKASQEYDDNKYMALVAEFETALKNSIPQFEKAYAITKDNETKLSVADFLKNAYYRFRDEDPKYMEGYEKYSKIVAGE